MDLDLAVDIVMLLRQLVDLIVRAGDRCIQLLAGILEFILQDLNLGLLDVQRLHARGQILLMLGQGADILLQLVNHLIVMLGNALDDVDLRKHIIEARCADQRRQQTVIAVDIERADALFEELEAVLDLQLLSVDLLLQAGDLLLLCRDIADDAGHLRVDQQQLAVDEIDFLFECLFILGFAADIVCELCQLFLLGVDLCLFLLFLLFDLLERLCGRRHRRLTVNLHCHR